MKEEEGKRRRSDGADGEAEVNTTTNIGYIFRLYFIFFELLGWKLPKGEKIIATLNMLKF